MVEEKDFLPLEELTKQSHEFKQKWYGITKKAETLSNYKSGFDEGFKGAIKSIYDDIDTCKDYVDGFEHHLKHYFPKKRSDVTWLTKKVFRHLEDLRVMAKKDYDVLENSKDLSKGLKSLIADLEEAERKLKASEEKSGDACRKYFDMKNEYTTEYQGIEEKTKKKTDKIREKFVEMTTPIVEGHDISVSGRTVSIQELFELLSEKPSDTEKINLVIKKGGLFGKKSETDVAKTSVLKYVSSEILEGVPPINKERKKLIDDLKSRYSELPRLEKACEESEKQRKKLEAPAEELRAKIADIKKSEVFKFADYDGILETREQYLDKISEAEGEVKEYLDFALLNLKGFAELEPDVEKRNLLSEIKATKTRSDALEKEASKAREELSSKIKELTSMTAAKEDLEKQLEKSIERQQAAEKQTALYKKRAAELSKSLNNLETALKSNLAKMQSEMEAKLADINKAMTSASGDKGSEEHKVEKKMEKLRGKRK